ncbi:MAG TPA: trehalose-phosphatase [Burkholderiaceae bacterium]|nr:trehalose-phosphatase [Burkholderiaceae bacterium]
MRHLFHRAGRAALVTTLAGRPLLAFDFDGTLAPMIARPEEARVGAAVAELLARLASQCQVAVITGRSVDDVRPRLGFAPQYIVGNHGAEDPDDLKRIDMSVLASFRRRLEDNAERLRSAQVRVEDKGYSIALSYHSASDPVLAQRCCESLLRDLDSGLHFFGGKFVANVVVAGAPDKADALATLVARSGADAALFVGDDINDEAVFARAEPTWLTVRIGRDDPLSRADFFLDDHAEIATLLEILLDVLAQSKGN